jgi:hypothetical protein
VVEHLLAKERVASSNLVFRSIRYIPWGDVAKWIRRGSAKPLFTGSNPVVASNYLAGVAELADAADLKSAGLSPCGFESHPRHQ